MNRNSIVANFAKNMESVNNAATNAAANIVSNINKNSVGHTIYVWVFVIGITMGVIYLIKRYIIDENPTMIQSWISKFRGDATVAPVAPVHPDIESWCFVGEDLTGRYCVKVPSAKSCDAARTYKSRQDCELVPAQHLPAGVVTKQGAGMLPLLSGN